MAEDVMLNEAIEAIRQGQRSRARDLLTRLLRANQNNPAYWIWMSSVVDTRKEQVFCLQSALKIDPQNPTARQGLIVIGEQPPDGSITPAEITRRNWEVETQEIPKRKLWDHPVVRIGVFAFAGVIFTGLIILGIIGISGQRRQQVAVVIPTSTPGPSPTFTYTPTPINFTPQAPTATLRFSRTSTGVPPLSSLLQETYTPTPPYINTPHPANEAFRLAMRAWQNGDYQGALQNFQQASQMSPNAPDIQYMVGELHRQQGNFTAALRAYENAMQIDPDFSPPYLGRALVLIETRPNDTRSITADITKAIELDPNYGLAYLEYAMYLLDQKKADLAAEQLEIAEELLPGSPLVFLHRAQIFLQMEDLEKALEYARKANQADLTLLLSYRLLGEAAILNEQFDEALQALKVFLTYEQNDALAWMLQGQALYATGQFSQTVTSMNTALNLNRNLSLAIRYRGLAYLELGEGQKAVNDLFTAMQGDMQSYEMNLGMGRGLFLANRLTDSPSYFNRAERLAETDHQKAAVFYWRAQLYEALGNMPNALRDWQALLDLPEDAMPQEWRTMAEAHLAATSTPAPSATPTRTTPTAATPSPSATGTPTPGRTP